MKLKRKGKTTVNNLVFIFDFWKSTKLAEISQYILLTIAHIPVVN